MPKMAWQIRKYDGEVSNAYPKYSIQRRNNFNSMVSEEDSQSITNRIVTLISVG